MELIMKENGMKIGNMDKDLNVGQMGLLIMELTLMVKSMEQVTLSGLKKVNLKVSLSKIIFKVMVSILGVMGERMKVLGKTIRWRVKEYLNGQMVVLT